MRSKLFLVILACITATHLPAPAGRFTRRDAQRAAQYAVVNPITPAHSAKPTSRRTAKDYGDDHHVRAANEIMRRAEAKGSISSEDETEYLHHARQVSIPVKYDGDLIRTKWHAFKADRAEKKARKTDDPAQNAFASYMRTIQHGHTMEQFGRITPHEADAEAHANKLRFLEGMHRSLLRQSVREYKDLHAAGKLTEKQKAEHNELAKIMREKYPTYTSRSVDPSSVQLEVK